MPVPPILVADLFPEISSHLISLLKSLAPDEWALPTVSSRRTVKDIASHLLDGSLRRLSMQRDGYRPADGRSQPRSNESLIDFLNRLNDEWETGTRRLSPRVLIDLIDAADIQLAQHFQSLDPYGEAIFPVAWAGEEKSENWMDIARDYTEKWHHTQQIFDATKRDSTIMTKQLGRPCYDIFMRALPFTYRHVPAKTGTVVSVSIVGDAGGEWSITKEDRTWRQVAECNMRPESIVVIDEDVAWKLFTKRRNIEEARHLFPTIQIVGNEQLGAHLLTMVSVMA
jgi:hypothetical protein